MSIGKTIGVVTMIGGIGFIGYSFLEKNKPTIANEQLNQLQSDIKSTSTAVYTPPAKTALEIWQAKYAKMTPLERAKLSTTTIYAGNMLGIYEESEFGQAERVKVEFPLPNEDITKLGINSCKALDVVLRNIIIKSSEEAQKILNGQGSKFYLYAMKNRELILRQVFTANDCAIQFENARLDESGALITESAIKAEKSVLENAFFDENVYLKLGGGVLLVGLFIVLKSTE
jgi:hypothetical protein